MQNSQSTYRERLAPSLWTLGAAAVIAPMAALVFVPFNSALALAAGVVVAVGVVALLLALSPRLEVRGSRLLAGRANIDARWLGAAKALTGEDARLARGAQMDRSAWLLIRGGIDGLVVVPNTDPADPASAWVISSRTPERLAAAIEIARYAAQSRQTAPMERSSAT